VPVIVTGLPDIVVYWGTVVVAVLASPVYASPRMGATFETTVSVPRAEMEGVKVTVSPITKPFVLATVRFRGLVDVDAVVTFDAVPCVTTVPDGMGAYGKGLRFRDVLSVVETIVNVPTPTKVAGPGEKPDVFEIGTARAAPGWYPPELVLTTF
jgi:hypothetical protein